MKNFLFPLILITQGSYATNIEYKNNNIHAFLPKENNLYFSGNIEKINDELDFLNIKKSETKNSTNNNLDSLGDMDGINLNIGYSINKDWYFNLKWNQKELQYSGSTLVNEEVDTYLRYQLYNTKNLAFAIDGGYKMNIAKDTSIYDLKIINDTLEDIAPNKEIEISEDNNKHTLIYTEEQGSVKTVDLNNQPYIAIVDTKDTTFYGRAILSLKQDAWLFDIYTGYAETTINIGTDSSIFYEDDSDLQAELDNISLTQKRTDAMLFGGIGASYKFYNFYFETSYKYNYLLRIDGLNEVQQNHIFSLDTHYMIQKNLSFFLGGQIMSNHFNGEIPYLYGEYTDTSFDHKYGFLRTGFTFNF